VKSYLAVRVESFSNRVFLNYHGEPISERGIRKLVVKYRGTRLRRDTVITQWFQASKAAAASDGHAVHC
jgi:hypothetical protein